MMRFLALIVFINGYVLQLSRGQTPLPQLLTPVVPVLRVPVLPDSMRRRHQLTSIRFCPPTGRVRFITAWTPPAFLTVQPCLTAIVGVQVTPHSGAPGDWATVRIRGGSSLAGTDQPLYVIDGLPALNADFAPGLPAGDTYGFGHVPQPAQTGANPLLALPPEEVEQVEVMSSALGTAEYGAQGSNGVVLITTRRGGAALKKQAPRLRYAGYAGVQQVRQRYSLLNAPQYADLANEAWANAPQHDRNPPFGPSALAGLGTGTDWQAELFRPALLQSHHLTFDGSGPRTRYLASADYLSQDGVVRGSGLHRYALRLNLDQQVSVRLHLLLNASASHLAQALPDPAAVPAALLAPPTLPARNPDGSYYQTNGYYQNGYSQSTFYNPLALATDAGYHGTTRRLLLQAGASYLLPRLHLTARLLGSREQLAGAGTSQSLLVEPSSTAAPAPLANQVSSQEVSVSIAQLHLDYNYDFNSYSNHLLTIAFLAGTQQYQRAQSSSGSSPGYSTGYNAASTSYAQPYASLWASYSYHRRYTVLATARADASPAADGVSAAAPTTLLPGAEVRWDLGNEDFMYDSQQGHRLGLRTATLWAGAGQSSNTGLVATGLTNTAFTPLSLYAGRSNSPTTPPRTTQYEAGLRLGFFDDKLQLDFTAYHRTTGHLPVPQAFALPSQTGYTSYTEVRDVALRNQGLLLSISSSWKLGALRGSTRVAATLQQQRVLAVDDANGLGPVPGLAVGEAPHPYLLYQREAVGTNFSHYANGASAAGRIRYQDLDGDGHLTDADARYQGTALPTQLLTLVQHLEYQRFGLDAQVDAQGGHQLLNTTLARLELPTGNTNGTLALLDRWTPTQYNAEIPQASPAIVPPRYNNYTPQYADNLRLTQLTFSYALRPAGFSHPLSVWAGVQNLFVITHYKGFDPNVSSGGATQLAAGYDTNYYPVPRTWLLGVKAEF